MLTKNQAMRYKASLMAMIEAVDMIKKRYQGWKNILQ